MSLWFIVHSSFALPLLREEPICWNSRPLEVNNLHRVDLSEIGSREILKVEIPEAGLVTLEALPQLSQFMESEIHFLGPDCETLGLPNSSWHLEKNLPNLISVLLKKSGVYYFLIRAQSPLAFLGAIKIKVDFVASGTVDALALFDRSGSGNSLGLEERFEDNNDPGEDGPPPGLEDDPITEILLPLPPGGCSQEAADDHSDGFECATPLLVGLTEQGEMQNPWGDDTDTFTFTLEKLQTIRIEGHGFAGLMAALYDHHGQRLAIEEPRSDASSFRIFKALNRGRYFLRLEGAVGMEGTYSILIGVHEP